MLTAPSLNRRFPERRGPRRQWRTSVAHSPLERSRAPSPPLTLFLLRVGMLWILRRAGKDRRCSMRHTCRLRRRSHLPHPRTGPQTGTRGETRLASGCGRRGRRSLRRCTVTGLFSFRRIPSRTRRAGGSASLRSSISERLHVCTIGVGCSGAVRYTLLEFSSFSGYLRASRNW